MKRPLVSAFITLFLLASASLALGVWAAPVAQETRPVIAQPAQDTAVRGAVQIVGSATHPQFQKYQIYFAPWPVPSDDSWAFVSEAFSPQQLGLLGAWDSRTVTDGTYALRVRVVKQDGNYLDSDPRRVLVANTRPIESPTPAVTDTPEPLPTEPPATPTIVVAVPTVAEKSTAAPTSTPEPKATPILPVGPTAATVQPGAPAGSSSAATTDQLFSGQRLLGTAKKAAFYTAAAFVIVGLFFGVKAILVWLWQKLRP